MMIDWTHFHFLRPGWLYAVLFVLPLAWIVLRSQRSGGAWQKICDAHLLRHLLVESGGRAQRWPLALLALGWVAACLALAGPAWERIPQPAFESPEQRVFVLSLSPSMNATDVTPSRLDRARYEVQDALNAMGDGRVGLVIFNEEPYVVTPISDDPRLVSQILPMLETGLMPGRGVEVGRAIDQARLLLERAGAPSGGIVLFTDGAGDRPESAVEAAKNAADAGYEVSVLAIGSEEGAPVPAAGGFVRDGSGKLRMTRIDRAALEAIASAGRGAFAMMRADDRDLEAVLRLRSTPLPGSVALEKAGFEADTWRDVGIYLVWMLVGFAPLAFRRGWATSVAVVLAVGAGTLSPGAAQAGIRDWMLRADQRAAEAFEAGRHDEAAALFEDREWRSAALYRDGRYDEAAELLSESAATESHYNLGNTLARSGQLQQALEAYEEVLDGNAEHADARHNHDLVARLLEEQQQAPQSKPPTEGSDEGEASESEESQAGDSEGSQPPDASGEGSEPQGSSDGGSDGTSESSGGQPDASDESQGSNASGEDQAAGTAPASASNESGDHADPPGDSSATDHARQVDGEGGRDGRESKNEMATSLGAEESSDLGDFEDMREPPAQSLAGSPENPRADEGRSEPDTTTRPRSAMNDAPLSERDQAVEQWLNRISDDPAGLLREKLRRRYAQERYTRRAGGRIR
jgi:Ca-activated chloride channel family protein